MKKIISVLLATVFAVSALSGASFAAVEESFYIEELTGAPIDETGRQYNSTSDTIAPGQTIYYLLPDEAGKVLADSKNFRVSARKSQNSKLVKSVNIVDKRLTSGAGYYYVPVKDTAGVTQKTRTAANGRNKYIAITLNDTTSTEELKVDLSITLTVKKSATSANAYAFRPGSATLVDGSAFATRPDSFMKNTMSANGDKLTLRTVFYVGNSEESGDAIVSVGTSGKTIRPIANEYNEIIFETESEELARVSFDASSNPAKFLAKLSTKWTSSLSRQFYNNDAVVRSFSAATVDSVSRATLSLNNPFDDDIRPSRVYIYTVSSKGTLSNVTSQFTYNAENNSFDTKTRTLGTYVLSVGKASPQKS